MALIPTRLGKFAPLLLVCAPIAVTAQTFSSSDHEFRLDTVAEGLEHPWALTFLPNGDQLVTERAGRLRLIHQGELVEKPVTGIPDHLVAGQGGLLDIVLHPDFEDNRLRPAES